MTGTKPKLSVLVVFHDMQRESARTLETLAVPYQRGVDPAQYEVIAIDNGSATPLEPATGAAIGRSNITFRREDPASPSPCAAINRAAAAATGQYLMVCIDGARMLSPGLLQSALAALDDHRHPFVYTLGMHLGPAVQNKSMVAGYDQQAEDRLLAGTPWREDGYRLFGISSLASSSHEGFFGRLSESNCFALRRDDFLELGGMDERFESPGGGLVNLDFFNRVHERPETAPVMLLGEATFHQFHGGVATNVPVAEHPWARMAQEYLRIKGKPYAKTVVRPEYRGWLSPRYHAALMP